MTDKPNNARPTDPQGTLADLPAVEIADVPDARRYEARIDGELAGWVDYGRVRERLVAVHTEVRPQFGGRGIGKALVRRVIADARAGGFTITPRCPLFAAHFERYPHDADVLAGPPRT